MDRSDADFEDLREPATARPAPVTGAPGSANRKKSSAFDVSAMARPEAEWPPLHGFDLWPDPAIAFEAARRRQPTPVLSVVTADTATPSSPGLRLPHLGTAAKFAALAVAAWFGFILFLAVLYRFVDPPFSTLMVKQRLTGGEVTQTWVPLEAVSPHAVRAVLLSEDGRFCQHWGVDFDEMQNAIERAADGVPRGASTISMQVTKNLFLWSSKSYLRKAIEIPLTFFIETIWPKRRIMEIYLNIAEWGPGIFGVEAASRYHFDKPASRLGEREAAQLAVALPNPIRRDAGDPGPKTRRLASDIQARMRAAPSYATSCVKTARPAISRVTGTNFKP